MRLVHKVSFIDHKDKSSYYIICGKTRVGMIPYHLSTTDTKAEAVSNRWDKVTCKECLELAPWKFTSVETQQRAKRESKEKHENIVDNINAE